MPEIILLPLINWAQTYTKRGFNNEVQHLEEQEGACYSKWICENNIGVERNFYLVAGLATGGIYLDNWRG